MLFDIDGTLVSRAGPEHKLALVEAVRSVANCAVSFDGVPTHGMLDCDLFRLLLAPVLTDPTQIDEFLPALIAEAQRHYLLNCTGDLRHRVCPGVVSFLDTLQSAGIPCAIVSGNLSAIGWRKLELAGLRHYFEGGAFSEQASSRGALVAATLDAHRSSGTLPPVVSLIGDHANDIRAARANGIRTIAVATGLSSQDELRSENPDHLLSDLTQATLDHVL